jgi:prepilin-type N-terminal cleavage/methylation domain-containing protein
MKALFGNEKGFSLIEVLIAIFILLMVVIVFMTLSNFSISGIVSSRDRSDILFNIQKELEAENPTPAVDNQAIDIIFNNGVSITGKQGTFVQSMPDGKEVTINVFIPD